MRCRFAVRHLLMMTSAMLVPAVGRSADEPPAEPAETSPAISAAEDDVPVTRLTPEGPDVPWDARRVGPFSLQDQNGDPVTNETLRGKPWIANFIFTRCAFECPQLLGKTNDLLKRTKNVDYRVVTITVDPKHDDVPAMKRQADVFGVDPDRWLFVTGPADDVYDLIRKGFKQAAWENVGTDRTPGMEFAHSLNMIHVDAEGNIVGKYNGRSDEELQTLAQVLEGRREPPAKNRPFAVTTSAPPEAQFAPAVGGHAIPEWVQRLPATNAMLNTLATVLLLGGYSAIRVRHVRLHRKLMLFAFSTSAAFLVSYLTYHAALDHYTGSAGRKFQGDGWIRPVYFSILVSHIVLAIVIAVAAPTVMVLALRKRWTWHARLARVVYPIWLYVSVTGVVVYLMLYHLPAGLAAGIAPAANF